jgi:hypothetical protein
MTDFIATQQSNLSVVDTCNRPDSHRFLELPLHDSLETKGHAFPGFCFVSSNDLLDILSKGRNRQDIAQRFGKVFDDLVKVE